MPIIRKVHTVGGSKMIVLPKDWLRRMEKKHKGKIKEMAIEVSDVVIFKPMVKGKIIGGEK